MRQQVNVTIVVTLDADASLSAEALRDAAHDVLLCPLADLEALQDEDGDLFFCSAEIAGVTEEAEIYGLNEPDPAAEAERICREAEPLRPTVHLTIPEGSDQ